MYVKRIQLTNYGPISRIDLVCPFDDNKPKPIVLVGENGSGKTILLAHIVNGLLLAQQVAYPRNPEVDEGKVYKHRSSQYIQSGKEYSFSKVDFENGLHTSELRLRRAKQANQHLPESIEETDAQGLWRSISPEGDDTMSTTFEHAKQSLIEKIFTTHCVLYFPSNRFEEPAWLNERNLKSKAQYMNLAHVQGYTNRKIINHSPLRENRNWLLDVVYDYRVFEIQMRREIISYPQSNKSHAARLVTVFDGFSGRSKNLYDVASQIVQTLMPEIKEARLGFGKRWGRNLSVMTGDETHVPNIFQLSSGEVSLLNLFLSILRDYDLCGAPLDRPEDIRGVVAVDEIDLHLHTKHQYEILPKLMKMFPRVQFVITTHSPLFVLGLQKTLGDEGFALYHLPQGELISPEEFGEFGEAYWAFSDTRKHTEVIAAKIRDLQGPVVFVEGKTDVRYLTRAAELLGKQKTLQNIQIRDADGSRNLDKIWTILEKINIKHQVIILLYDGDRKAPASESEGVFRRTIPVISSHPIQKGIENLFSKETLEKAIGHKPAFIDYAERHKSWLRGKATQIPEQWSVGADEKTNLCNWLCETGTAEDFAYFKGIFDELDKILGLFLPISDHN